MKYIKTFRSFIIQHFHVFLLPCSCIFIRQRCTYATTGFHSSVPAFTGKRYVKVVFLSIFNIEIFICYFGNVYRIANISCTGPYGIVFQDKRFTFSRYCVLIRQSCHEKYHKSAAFFQKLCKSGNNNVIIKIEETLTSCYHVKAFIRKIKFFCR